MQRLTTLAESDLPQVPSLSPLDRDRRIRLQKS